MKKYDFIVYKTIDLSNNKIYIGYDSYNRIKYYGSGIYLLKRINKIISKYIKDVLKKDYTEINRISTFYYTYNDIITKFFKKEILEHYNTKEEMIGGEIKWIKHFNSTDKTIGYNILDYTWNKNQKNSNKEEYSKNQSKIAKDYWNKEGSKEKQKQNRYKYFENIENRENVGKMNLGKISKIYVFETPSNDILEIAGYNNVMKTLNCSKAIFDRKTYKGYKLIEIKEIKNGI